MDLKTAYDFARFSPDQSNQNGAYIEHRNGDMSMGFNDFPSHISDSQQIELLADRDEKLFYIGHAERCAIYTAAKLGRACEGETLICPWFACSDCAKAIIFSGIVRVIGHKQRMEMTHDRWKDNVAKANQMLIDHGVELEFYDGKIGCAPIIVNGEKWYP